MRKCIILLTFFAIALSVSLTSCQKKSVKEVTTGFEPIVTPCYQPTHIKNIVDLSTVERYHYFSTPLSHPAEFVSVTYDPKTPYAEPILIEYHYENGDTYTYVIPADFGLWNNEYGRLRVVIDEEATVWLQGQTKRGKFHEFVFYGNPAFNGKKIKPNSYHNHPDGVITHLD